MGSAFCPTIAERSDCHLKKNGLVFSDGVDQHDKKCPCGSRAFLFARLFVLGELALCRVLEDYSLSKSNRKSDNVGLPLGSIRLVDSPYRLVAIQRHRPHVTGKV